MGLIAFVRKQALRQSVTGYLRYQLKKMQFWQAVLLPLSVLPAFLLGVVLIHYHTSLIYSSESSSGVQTGNLRLQLIILGTSAVLLLIGVALLHKKGKDFTSSTYGAFGLLILIGFLVFSSLAWRILIGTVVAVPLIIAQGFAFTYKPHSPEAAAGRTGFTAILHVLRIVAFGGACVFGILLMSTTFHRTYRAAQWSEIYRKNLHVEIQQLDELRKPGDFEYVTIKADNLTLKHAATMRFGSGDNSFSLSYAQLSDTSEAAQKPGEWPFWMLCGAWKCDAKIYPVARLFRCKMPDGCSKDFLQVREVILQNAGISRGTPPAEFFLLEPDDELSKSADEWSRTWRARLQWLLLLQAAYFLLHAAALFSLKRRQKET